MKNTIYCEVEELVAGTGYIKGRITKNLIYRTLKAHHFDFLDRMCGVMGIDNNIYSFNKKPLLNIENSYTALYYNN